MADQQARMVMGRVLGVGCIDHKAETIRVDPPLM
jgi:hypothetical protein